MLLSKVVKMKWNGKNKAYYESIGYSFTKIGDEFDVRVEDLMPSSKATVSVLCDFCKEVIVEKKYQIYKRQHHEIYGDCCVNCQPLKNRLCCLEKYGVDNASKTDEVKQKIKDSFMDRYGVDNISKLDSVKEVLREKSIKNAPAAAEKYKSTMLERYGVTNSMYVEEFVKKQEDSVFENYGVRRPKQSKEVRDKEIERNLKKYGVKYPMQLSEFQEKREKTCLEKYGAKTSLGNKDVRAKIFKTLESNGTVKTSKQQIAIFELLTDLYGYCELNKLCGEVFLDCAIDVDGVLIDVEYDGKYWHQDKIRDRRRDEFVKSQGYKILRISSNRTVPTKQQLFDNIKILTTTDKYFIKVDLD